MIDQILRAASGSALAICMAAVFGLGATGADACGRGSVSGAGAVVPEDSGALNAGLLDAALLAEVNGVRCRAGLQPLGAAPGLLPVSQVHAQWMAQNGVITHSPALPGGLSSFGARLAASGYGNRAGAENIAMVHRFQLEGRPIFVRNAGACQFTDW